MRRSLREGLYFPLCGEPAQRELFELADKSPSDVQGLDDLVDCLRSIVADKVIANTLKYVVGVMLTAFGTFWGAEGAGVDWPGGDAAMPALIAFHGRRLARARSRVPTPTCAATPSAARADPHNPMSRLRSLGAFLYDFVIGDDPLIAAVVVVTLGITAVLAGDGISAWWILPVAILTVLGFSLHRATRF